MVNAPQFISIKGERIWANLDKQWTATNTVPREESPDPRRVWFLKNSIRTERSIIPSPGFPSAIMPQQATHSLIMAENFQGSACVGIANRNFRILFNNNDCILRCLHSEGFPIQSLSPGESKTQEGVLLFFDGNHKGLIKHFSKLCSEKWK